MKNLIMLFLLTMLSACSQSSKPLKTWQLSAQGLTAAALTNNHALLATIEQGGLLWQLKPKKLLHQFRHGNTQKQALIAVALSANGHYAVTADREGLAWWSVKTGKPLASWMLENIQDVAVSKDGRWALVGLSNQAVYLSLSTGKTRFAFPHNHKVATVSLDLKGKFALTGGNDGLAKLWNLRNGKLLHAWEHATKLATVTLSPQGTYAMTNANLGPVQIWKTRTGKRLRQLGPKFITATSAAFSPKEGLLAIGHPSQGIDLWHLKSGKRLRRFDPLRPDSWRPSASPVLALAFVKRSKYLLSVTSDGTVQKWRIKKKK